MNKSIGMGQPLSLLTAVLTAMAVCWVAGCAKKSGQTDVPETPDTLIDRREWDWKTYRTVKIGNQTWMAENLNYQAESGSWCYEDSSSYCNEYGRLYDWNAAMKACPVGYHLPSRGEWDSLSMAVGAKRDSGVVWDKRIWRRYTDDYEFSALPGGYRYPGGRVGRRVDFYYIKAFFVGAGNTGYWWTATEQTDSSAYLWDMDGKFDGTHKNVALSARCLKNADRPQSPSPQRSDTANKSDIKRQVSSLSRLAGEAARWVRKKIGPETTPNTLTDKRDGKVYRTVKMQDGKTWTAENLNYQTDSSWCYNDSPDSCAKYGRLYDWNAATKACPKGWHLPTPQEWDYLGFSARGEMTPDDFVNNHWRGAGKKLKARKWWNDFLDDRSYSHMTRGYNYPYKDWVFPVKRGNGTDDYRFSALPGGYRRSFDGGFDDAGDYGSWWMAAENDAYTAYLSSMGHDTDIVRSGYSNKKGGRSVRCVKDN